MRRNTEILTPEEVLERYTSGPKTGVFTDGSCEGNPGPGSWAFVWVEDDRIVDGTPSGLRPEHDEQPHGAHGADRGLPQPCPKTSAITVYSDSHLCVKTMNEWVARAGRGAAGAAKRARSRTSSWCRELYALANSPPRGEALRWIKAHDGSRWNEYADALATARMRDAG